MSTGSDLGGQAGKPGEGPEVVANPIAPDDAEDLKEAPTSDREEQVATASTG